MNTTTCATEMFELVKRKRMLSALDWRVWFLGCGLGGCFGLGLSVGFWSLIVDDEKVPGIASIAISLIHFFFIATFWIKRKNTIANFAIRLCYLISGSGIAAVALLLNESGSQVPGAAVLYGLAFMNLLLAITSPLLHQQRLAEPSDRLEVAEP